MPRAVGRHSEQIVARQSRFSPSSVVELWRVCSFWFLVPLIQRQCRYFRSFRLRGTFLGKSGPRRAGGVLSPTSCLFVLLRWLRGAKKGVRRYLAASYGIEAGGGKTLGKYAFFVEAAGRQGSEKHFVDLRRSEAYSSRSAPSASSCRDPGRVSDLRQRRRTNRRRGIRRLWGHVWA